MFDTLQKPVYTLEQASQIAEEAAARALKSFVAQFAPGIGSAPHLENRIPPQNVHPSELPKITLTVKDMADWAEQVSERAAPIGLARLHIGHSRTLVLRHRLHDGQCRVLSEKGGHGKRA